MLEVSFQKTVGEFLLSSRFQTEKEIIGILGPSGCGKSLTLKCIAGLETPDEGKILLNSKVLYDSQTGTNVPPRFRNVGYVFQQYALFPHLTVAQNIAFGIHKLDKMTRQQRVQDMLQRMRLDGLQDRYPHQLSGGQQQRVALARTLVTQPDLLLLDEPFSAIDNHVKHLLEQELLELIQKNYSGTVLLVTHNMEEAYRLCNRIILYSKGQVVQTGHKEDILIHPVSLTAARIMGCKNLFPVHIIGEENGVLALQSGGLKLHAKKANANYAKTMIAGCHAHVIRLHTDSSLTINNYPCEIEDTIEGMFFYSVFVRCAEHRFQIEVAKETWQQLANGQLLYLHLPPEHVFVVAREEHYLSME